MESISQFVISLTDNDKLYLFNTKNNISVCVDNTLINKMQIDESIKKSYNDFLREKSFFSEENELDKMCEIFRNRDETCLRIIIFAHGDCNFRCKYCYENFSPKSINDKIESICNFIINKASEKHFEEINISWFGGEPLLGYREIIEISERLISFTSAHNIKYTSDITTNGYLLSYSVISELICKAKVNAYQITIDGSRHGHDKQRILKNGMGTYQKIISNLTEIVKSNLRFSIFIRINISKENYDYVSDFLLNDGLIFKSDPRFYLIFRNVGDWGNGDREGDYYVESLETDVSYDLSCKAIELGYKIGDIPLGYSNNYICYAQRANAYAIDTNGNILKCTVALYDEKNKIGSIFRDNNLNRQAEKLWLTKYHPSDKCINCKYWLICKGGSCPNKFLADSHSIEEQCQKNKTRINNMLRLAIKQKCINYFLEADT
ncbi:MAG: SPASM domain-containing protein [Acetatifactor sp.]|nr:SPASM domain-containing protein [Acetatifactor sp.]